MTGGPLFWGCAAAAIAVLAPAGDWAVRFGALLQDGRVAGSAPGDSLPGRSLAARLRRRGRWSAAKTSAGLVTMSAAALVMFAGWRCGPAIATACAAVLGTAALAIRDALRSRQLERDHAELATAVRVLVAELEAGATPALALSAAAGSATTHRAVLTQAAELAAVGADASDLLLNSPTTQAVGAAWAVSQDTGAALAAALGRVAADLESARSRRRAVSVALSGPRSSAALLTGLPVLGVVLGVAMGARPGRFLLDLPAGRLVCCAGVLLDVCGVWWMRRIVGSARRD